MTLREYLLLIFDLDFVAAGSFLIICFRLQAYRLRWWGQRIEQGDAR